MYKLIKKLKRKKGVKDSEGKILNMAIIMFVCFSLLNVFLIFNFINILSNVKII